MNQVKRPKPGYYVSIKVGIESPFHARIFEVGNGMKFETQLASLADVEGFLEDVRPISWVDEVRWSEDGSSMTVVSRQSESLGVLVERAARNLDLEQHSVGHADLILADEDLETLRGRFEKWKRTAAPRKV